MKGRLRILLKDGDIQGSMGTFLTRCSDFLQVRAADEAAGQKRLIVNAELAPLQDIGAIRQLLYCRMVCRKPAVSCGLMRT